MFPSPVYRFAREFYDQTIRPYLPYKIGVYNNVAVVDEVRLFDQTEILPNYKRANIEYLREHISQDDKVIIIGGGIGVTSVVSARITGKGGEVLVYEASREQANKTTRNINLNGEEDVCTVNHAVVGELSQAGGLLGDPKEVPANNLPNCDLIEMDWRVQNIIS